MQQIKDNSNNSVFVANNKQYLGNKIDKYRANKMLSIHVICRDYNVIIFVYFNIKYENTSYILISYFH